MADYVRNVEQVIKLNTQVTATVTRDPLIWKILIWVLAFITLFLIFQHFLIKFLEKIIKKDKSWWGDIIVSVITLFILILMIRFTIHYGPVDLLRPVSSAFGIGN